MWIKSIQSYVCTTQYSVAIFYDKPCQIISVIPLLRVHDIIYPKLVDKVAARRFLFLGCVYMTCRHDMSPFIIHVT